MSYGYGAFGCGPAAPVAPAVVGGSTTGLILVLFILLVIILRTIHC